jgi:heparan-alpha-glucosaminide N-acetyltransferase
MNTPTTPAPGAPTAATLGGPPNAFRLASLDAFRGLVILTMTFVNYLAGIANIPAWAKHRTPNTDGFTFVDVVFPGFLFIVGVAIPFAFHKRLARGEKLPGLLWRIATRAASLLFVGVLTVNRSRYSSDATGMRADWWFLLAMVSVCVLWSHLPANASALKRRIFFGLRIGCGLLLAWLLCIVRTKTAAGEVAWLQSQWWGILGLIGWAYLASSLAYVVCRGNPTALMGVLGGMILLYTGGRHGALDWLGPVNDWVNPGSVFGTTSADVMIGILVGSCFVGPAAMAAHAARIRFMLFFGVGLIAAGYLVRPLHGIDKNAATEAYALITGGICCLSLLVVYAVMDIWHKKAWAEWLIPVGQNALLAYLMPGMLNGLLALVGLKKLFFHYPSGLPGALNCALLTALVAALTWLATRRGVLVRL